MREDRREKVRAAGSGPRARLTKKKNKKKEEEKKRKKKEKSAEGMKIVQKCIAPAPHPLLFARLSSRPLPSPGGAARARLLPDWSSRPSGRMLPLRSRRPLLLRLLLRSGAPSYLRASGSSTPSPAGPARRPAFLSESTCCLVKFRFLEVRTGLLTGYCGLWQIFGGIRWRLSENRFVNWYFVRN